MYSIRAVGVIAWNCFDLRRSAYTRKNGTFFFEPVGIFCVIRFFCSSPVFFLMHPLPLRYSLIESRYCCILFTFQRMRRPTFTRAPAAVAISVAVKRPQDKRRCSVGVSTVRQSFISWIIAVVFVALIWSPSFCGVGCCYESIIAIWQIRPDLPRFWFLVIPRDSSCQNMISEIIKRAAKMKRLSSVFLTNMANNDILIENSNSRGASVLYPCCSGQPRPCWHTFWHTFLLHWMEKDRNKSGEWWRYCRLLLLDRNRRRAAVQFYILQVIWSMNELWTPDFTGFAAFLIRCFLSTDTPFDTPLKKKRLCPGYWHE